MDISSIALQGLDQASKQLDAAASSITAIGAPQIAVSLDTVNLSEDLIALMGSKNAFEAKFDVLKTADQILRSTLNLLA